MLLRPDVSRHVESKKPLLMFVDRHGDVDGVTLDRDEIDQQDLDEQGVYFRLMEEATFSRKPYFQICTVVGGVIRDQGGDAIELDDLPAALNTAEKERIRFYTEREEMYGAGAWPR